ncbi:hypothetical protein NDU88_011912 [Pleurodeles waltl]|uniref:Uncharacterized protein n=1 Tax=Pleurodeles waltl TaxID=8319 RepID=A0AAV7QYN9_PLEWA|nr:hypothetical protein NDU88_011912 [Pleurodeles waltl]
MPLRVRCHAPAHGVARTGTLVQVEEAVRASGGHWRRAALEVRRVRTLTSRVALRGATGGNPGRGSTCQELLQNGQKSREAVSTGDKTLPFVCSSKVPTSEDKSNTFFQEWGRGNIPLESTGLDNIGGCPVLSQVEAGKDGPLSEGSDAIRQRKRREKSPKEVKSITGRRKSPSQTVTWGRRKKQSPPVRQKRVTPSLRSFFKAQNLVGVLAISLTTPHSSRGSSGGMEAAAEGQRDIVLIPPTPQCPKLMGVGGHSEPVLGAMNDDLGFAQGPNLLVKELGNLSESSGGTDFETLTLMEHIGSQKPHSDMTTVTNVQALQTSLLESLLHSLTKEVKQGVAGPSEGNPGGL